MNSLSNLSPWKTVGLTCLFELGLGGLAFLVGKFALIDPIANFHWSWIAIRGGLLTPLIPLAIFSLLIWIKNAPTLKYLAELKGWMEDLFDGWKPEQFFLLALCAGIGEEMLFRGLIQEGLIALTGPWPALIITGVAFGMLHWLNNFYFIWATFMGMFFGALYWQSGNLLAPIICHGLYDFLCTIILTRWAFPKISTK